MNKELKNKLTQFAKDRANEVEEVDINELMSLVIDGAKWMLKNTK